MADHNPKTKKALRGAMPKLRIEGLERVLEAEPGEDVRKACVQGHVNLFWSPWARLFNCRGVGLCGACPVRVLEANGNLPARTKKEEKRLKGRPEDWRLACQLEIRSDLKVEPFPLRPPEEVVGAEAVRRAGLEQEEYNELLQKEREQRLQTRRAKVEEDLAKKKKRRSKLFAFFSKRLGKGKDDEAEEGKEGKKEQQGKKEKKGGALAARFRKKPKDAQDGDKKKEGAKSSKGDEGEGKKKGFKLGKGKKKKETADDPSGGPGGE